MHAPLCAVLCSRQVGMLLLVLATWLPLMALMAWLCELREEGDHVSPPYNPLTATHC